MLSTLQKKYYALIKPFVVWYLKKPRWYRYQDLNLKIYPGVFHPHLFFSTETMVELLNELEIAGKSFCEVGAGSALISFLAAKKRAKVTAIEINPQAIRGIHENLECNKTEKFQTYESDLFTNVPPQVFDVVFINPPWFFKPQNGYSSLAWNCGENGEFFQKLFPTLRRFTSPESEIYMILAENADINRIGAMADKSGWRMTVYKETQKKWEKNYIFKLIRN